MKTRSLALASTLLRVAAFARTLAVLAVPAVLPLLGACATERPRDAGALNHPASTAAASSTAPPSDQGNLGADIELDAGAAGAATKLAGDELEPDGNDDDEEIGDVHQSVPARARFEKVGTPPLALTRICDLSAHGGVLYAAHANQPLGTDGATVTRYDPSAKRPFSVAFDWNRPGEPTKGGGAGQGFLRVRTIGGRLFVADADPPYNGLGLAEYGTEGYVFVSDGRGVFAAARAPHFRPPEAPDLARADGRAGAAVLPRAYHVIDVARFDGALWASTGSVPPGERAWRGPSPGALHRASDAGARWTFEVDYPYPYVDDVHRLTYLVRFRGRLYAGVQDYDGREPNDYVYFAPEVPTRRGPAGADGGASEAGKASDAGADAGRPRLLGREHVHAVRVTSRGGAQTLRWWVDRSVTPHRLYWIAWGREGVVLRVTTDGDRWEVVPLPEDAGRPTDITRFRDAVVVLAERGLYRLRGAAIDGGAGNASAAAIARVDDKRSPFELGDVFCVAPLAVLSDMLYAGGQRGGALYRLAAAE